jgi:hypothetical protein
MSQTLLQEAKHIGEQLSTPEKVELIDWLTSQLPQNPEIHHSKSASSHQLAPHAAHGHFATSPQPVDRLGEEDLAEWTIEEVRAMIHPAPKTGAEIAAMIESGEIDTNVGAELEVPDAVTWLENLRRQERVDRGLME